MPEAELFVLQVIRARLSYTVRYSNLCVMQKDMDMPLFYVFGKTGDSLYYALTYATFDKYRLSKTFETEKALHYSTEAQ